MSTYQALRLYYGSRAGSMAETFNQSLGFVGLQQEYHQTLQHFLASAGLVVAVVDLVVVVVKVVR